MVAIAVEPRRVPELEDAIRRTGASVVPLEEADAIVWTVPGEPRRLAALLRPQHRWVALPIAGVERWLESGVVDGSRTWTCAKRVYAPGVTEHALALVLAAARRLHEYARASEWTPLAGRRLAETTVLVLGAGGIGGELARLAAPTGAQLVGVNRTGAPVEGFAETVALDRLVPALAPADFLVVAAALTPETERVVGHEALTALGPEGWVVNVSRGGLVDTDALVAALGDGRLGGAALDVTEPEPLPSDHPLWGFQNVLLTPHVANPNRGNPWDSHLPELLAHLEDNIRAFAAGEPLAGTIDLAAGY